MAQATITAEQRTARAAAIAASIRDALTAAEYDLPADAVVTEAARQIAVWNDLDAALSDAAIHGDVLSPEYGCLLHYRGALREAGHPDLIRQRLLRWADDADGHAVKHEAAHREWADKAEQRRRGLWQMFGDGELEATADAARRCATNEREQAAALRRRAQRLGRRAA